MSLELAYKLFFKGNIMEAKKIVKKIIEKSKSPSAYFLYGFILYREKLFHDALWAVNKSIKLNQDFYEAWTLKAKILRSLGKLKEAIVCLDRALEIILETENYLDYELLILKALFYLEIGDIKHAREELNKAKEINPYDEAIKELEEKINLFEQKKGEK